MCPAAMGLGTNNFTRQSSQQNVTLRDLQHTNSTMSQECRLVGRGRHDHTTHCRPSLRHQATHSNSSDRWLIKEGLCTAAITFRTTLQDERSITLVQMTPGFGTDVTPYRAELGGLFGIAAFLQRLSNAHDCTGGGITVACDCKGALHRSMSLTAPTPNVPHFDILSEIYRLQQDTPIEWTSHWVKGHQDDMAQINTLDQWARLNIEMDHLAKAHWERLNGHRPAPFSLPPSQGMWSIWQHGQRLTTWNKETADQLYFNQEARLYWAQKYEDFPALDYHAIRFAYKSCTIYYQLRVPKVIGRWLPVGNRTLRWNITQTGECPRCGIDEESHLHVLACQHPGAVARSTRWLDDLELWLAKQHTNPTLRFGIISLLKAGFQEQDWVPPRTSDQAILRLFQKQQQQGTHKVLFGWWAEGWAEIQQAYYVSLSRKTTGKRWLSRLIRKQWEIAWDLWRHRLGVAATPDSFSLARAHESINVAIQDAFTRLSASNYQPLRRWFKQPIHVVQQQHLAFKQDWLSMVQSFNVPLPPDT